MYHALMIGELVQLEDEIRRRRPYFRGRVQDGLVRCPKCERWQPQDRFFTSRGGPSTYCKLCHGEHKRESYRRRSGAQPRRWRPNATATCAWCAWCEQWVALEAFYANRGRKDGIAFFCIPCLNGPIAARQRLNRAVRRGAKPNKHKCECGRHKRVPDDACARCMALDGHATYDRIVISALRTLGGPATTEELAREVGWTHRHASRALSAVLRMPAPPIARLEVEIEGSSYVAYWTLAGARGARKNDQGRKKEQATT